MAFNGDFSVNVQGRVIECSGQNARGKARGLIFAVHGGGSRRVYFAKGAVAAPEVFASQGYAVLSCDRPGYGRNQDWDIGFDAQAAVLAEVLDTAIQMQSLRDMPVYLYGHSIGGMLSLLMANARSGRYAGVSMVGSGPVYHEASLGRLRQRIAAETGSHAASNLTPGRPRYAGPVGTYDDRAAAFDPEKHVPSLITDLREALGWPERLPAEAAKATVPVQFVMPEFDELWRPDAMATSAVADWFGRSPLVDAHVQRMAGHSILVHHIANAHLLKVMAFFQECELHRALAKRDLRTTTP